MEEWRVIPLDELMGRYEISTKGRIRRISRTVFYKDGRKRNIEQKILSPHASPKGYLDTIQYMVQELNE